MIRLCCILPILFLWQFSSLAGVKYVLNPAIKPPAPVREFRGVWVASVANIDWPSRKGLPSNVQKRELIHIFDRAVQFRANAVILQVRPACDALYQSSYEPWSEYLTGKMGRPPAPYYDPLQFAVQEAHRRGLELHAWFNPFRARHSGARSAPTAKHITRSKPAVVVDYHGDKWLDPGEKLVREHALKVIMDVVRRYDVDGVHLDDYFYPYPEPLKAGGIRDFPDTQSWKRYRAAGGRLDRKSWRRSNVDGFVESLYKGIKREKPWVKVGLSPFGIWRPGNPKSIRGLDAYDVLYADARKWLRLGWMDYCSPQLYWSIGSKAQSFPVLLDWWSSQNVKRRHLWPGLSISDVGKTRSVTEVLNQVNITRKRRGVTGQVYWSVKALREDRGGLARQLTSKYYNTPALVPASPWLDSVAPSPPGGIRFTREGAVQLNWNPAGKEIIRHWVVQLRTKDSWRTVLVPGHYRRYNLPVSLPDAISISAVDRVGNISRPLTLEKRTAK